MEEWTGDELAHAVTQVFSRGMKNYTTMVINAATN
jgi:hypothetical protein